VSPRRLEATVDLERWSEAEDAYSRRLSVLMAPTDPEGAVTKQDAIDLAQLRAVADRLRAAFFLVSLSSGVH